MGKQCKILYIIGRNDWQKDTVFNHILLKHLKQTQHKIVWEDPASKFLYLILKFENKYLNHLSVSQKNKNLRIAKFIYAMIHWSYFKHIIERRDTSPEAQKINLKKRILKLKTKKEIIIISRSAGGRFASSIADNINIKHIICLSYPFQNPFNGLDPDRYTHLETLKTPMLIIQGDKDEYGGIEIKNKYKFSSSIDINFVNADHSFLLNHNDWKYVLSKIDKIIHAN